MSELAAAKALDLGVVPTGLCLGSRTPGSWSVNGLFPCGLYNYDLIPPGVNNG